MNPSLKNSVKVLVREKRSPELLQGREEFKQRRRSKKECSNISSMTKGTEVDFLSPQAEGNLICNRTLESATNSRA